MTYGNQIGNEKNPLEVQLCNIDELEHMLLEYLADGWRVAQTRTFDMLRVEKEKECGLSHGYIDAHKADVELDYLRQSGRLKPIVAIGSQRAVAIMMFDDGGPIVPCEFTMLGSPVVLGDLECVRLPACIGPQLTWAYKSSVMANAVRSNGFGGAQENLLTALRALVTNARFRGQHVQLREAIMKCRTADGRWDGLMKQLERKRPEDSGEPIPKKPIYVTGLDECLFSIVANVLVFETDSLNERLLMAA
jgi:hypothetical protein